MRVLGGGRDPEEGAEPGEGTVVDSDGSDDKAVFDADAGGSTEPATRHVPVIDCLL